MKEEGRVCGCMRERDYLCCYRRMCTRVTVKSKPFWTSIFQLQFKLITKKNSVI